jgi:hypothetical protein
MTGWMTATVGLNAVWKLYIRDQHTVNSIKDSMEELAVVSVIKNISA